MKCPKLLLGAALLASTCLLTSHLGAAPVYWDVNGSTAGSGAINGSTTTWNGTDPLWNAAADGTAGTAAWVPGDTAIFAAGTDATGTYTVTVSGTQEISGLGFEEGTFTLSGGTIGIGTAAGGTANINVAAGLIATINSILAGSPSGTVVLTKTGAGTLVLGGANTFGGTSKRIAIQEGVLSFSSNGNLGNALNALDLGTSTTTATLRYTGATATISRLIALGAPVGSAVGNVIEITNAGTVLTLSGVLSGGPGNSTQTNPGANVAFTVRGAGTLDLSGANTFTGDIVIDGATYNVNALTDWGGSTVANTTSHTISLINGGKMAVTTTTAINPGSITTTTHNLLQIGTGGGTVDVISGGTLQLDDAGQFFGSGVLTKTGAGTLWLGNAFTNYTGGQVNLNGGILQLQNAQALGATGSQAAITMAGGTTLNLRTTGNTNFGSNITLTGNATIAPGRSASSSTSITHTLGTLTMGAHTLTVSLGANLTTNAVGHLIFGDTTFTGDVTFQLNNVQGTGVGTTTLGRIRGGAVARTITKQGNGTLIFAADTDSTDLAVGSLLLVKSGNAQVNAGNALGSATVQVGDTTGTAAAGFLLGADGVVFDNAITVNSGSTGVLSLGGSNTTGVATFTSAISLGSNLTLTAATGGTVRFDGNIVETGGARNVNKVGSGTVELRGANNYTGTTTVTAGTLAFTTVGDVGSGITSLGAPTTVADGTIVLAGGRLRYIGTTVGGHSTNRNFSMSVSSTIDASGVGPLTLTGTLTTADGSVTLDGTGVGNLNNTTLWAAGSGDDFNKNGTGTWNLYGATSAPDDWNITLGTINANATDSLNAADDVVIDGDGNADSVIVNLNAVDVFSGNEFFIRNGGRVNVTVDNALSGTDVNQLLIGDTASVGTAAARLHLGNPLQPTSTANISIGTAGVQVGASGGQTGRITGTGIITSTGTFSLRNGSIDAGITLAGTGGITKVGNGTVTFAGTRTTTGNTAIQEGELILDYSTNNTSKIGGVLTLGATTPNLVGGGTLTMNGIASGTTTETMTSTTISAGASEVKLNAGASGSVALNLGALTRTSVGGTVAFTYGTTNAVVNTTTVNAFLGYATLTTGGTTRLAATDAAGNIFQAATAAKSDIGTWVGADNVISTGAFTGQIGNRASIIKSLTFDAAVANTISSLPNRRLTISSGAILVNASVGANNTVISGGQLMGATTAPLGELIIHQNNTAGSLEIASNIVNSAGITKSGLGELILSGYNSFASSSTLVINEGRVTALGGNAIGDTTIVHMKQGTTLAIGDGVAETIGRLGIDGSNASHGTIALGDGSRLNVNQGSSATFSGVFTGGANTTITKTGNGNLQLLGNSSGFTGKVEVNGGLLYLSGASGKLSGVTSFTLNKGSVFMIDNDDDNSPPDRISSSASFTLNSADGNFSGETRPRGLTIRSDNNGDETQAIGVLTFGSGSSYGHLEADATGTNVAVASIVASNFIRNVGATMNVRGTSLGTSSTTINRGQLKIADGANEVAFLASTNLVGGSGTVGTSAKNVKIVPWAIGEATTGAPGDSNMGNTFLTYVDNRGFVPLDLATEYRTFAAGGTAQDNVREVLATGLAGVAGQTINSLVLHDSTAAAGTQAFTGTGPGQALTVTSGGFLFTLDPLATASSAHVINVNGFDDGIKVGSTNEYLFFVVNPTSTATTPTLTVNVSSPLNSTAASLTKAGRGTLVLSGTNTYGGGTYVNEGVLQISSLANLGTGGINFAGGTLRLSTGFVDDLSTRTLTTTSAGGFIDTNGINTVWSNGLDFAGTGSMAKTGNGLMTIQGASTYTGTFIAGHAASLTGALNGVSHGVLLDGVTNQAIAGNLQIGSTVVPSAGFAGVTLGKDEQIADTAVISFSATTARQAFFKMLGHSETVAGISDSTGGGVIENRNTDTVTSGATLTLNSNENYSFNGTIRDNSSGTADVNPLALVKMGSGTQILSGNQIRYTGGTTVSGGVLYLLNTTVFNSAIVNNSTVVFDYTSGTALTLARNLSGSGAFIKRGTGTVEWNGSNTFSGSVAVEEGVLSFTSGLGDNSVGNTVSIHEGATLRSTGADVTLGTNQSIDVGGSVATIDVAGAATNKLTVNGVISGGAQTALQKQGVGRLILSGANTYAGQTRVLAGALELRHASALGSSSSATVANGASMIFNASAAGPAGNFSFTGTGDVLTLGSTGGSTTLGFGINGASNDKIILGAGQTLLIGGTNVFTDIYINGTPTLSSYNLIQSAEATSYSQFTLGTIFNPGSFTYSLDTSGTNNLVLNVTAVAAPSVAYWKGDLGGAGTGVWSAYQIAPNSTNWDTDATSGIDTGVVPGATTDVFFAANGANNNATTLGADIAVRGVTFMAGTGTGGNNTTVGGPHTLTLGAGGVTLAAGSGSISISTLIAMAAEQTWTVTDANATLTASGGLSGNANFIKAGLGTVILSGDSSYTGTTTVSAGTLQIGAGGTTGTLGAGSVMNDGILIINRAGTYVVNQSISGSGSLIKTGTGTVTFNAVNSYIGSTTLNGGSTVFGVTQSAFSSASNTLIFGATNGSANASNLDLSTASATFGGAMTVQTNTTTANTITIGAGQSLNVEGNVMVGNAPTSGLSNTSLVVSGAGSFNVNNLISGAFFRVGGYEASTAAIGNRAIADFSGLASMNVSLNTTNGVVRVNNTSSGNTSGSYSTLLLAQNSTFTANALHIGDGGQFNNISDQINEVRLGSGVNTLNFNQINIGNGSRDYGALVFNTTTGSLIIRNAAGTGRATFNMATAGGTGTGTVNPIGNTFSTVGHNADLFLGVVTIGSQNRGNALVNTFSFDQGTLDMQRLVVSTRSANPGAGSVATWTTNSTVNLGGGTVNIVEGITNFAGTSGTLTAGTAVTATLNLTGGTITIGATAGNSVTMATAVAGTTSTATINISGTANVTMGGNIVKGGGAGTSTATVTLNGGTLDMTTKSIGSATNQVVFNAQQGTLRNLGEYNGGAALVKTTTGVLNMEGTHYYTGNTLVNDGTMNLVDATYSGTGNFMVAKTAPLSTTSVLSGTGTIATTVTVGSSTPGVSGILRPGTNVGTGHGTLTIGGNLEVNTGSQVQMSIGVATLVSTGYQAAMATGNALNALDYLSQNIGEVSVWNNSPTDPADHDYINITGAVSTPSIGDRASGTFGDGSILVNAGTGFTGAYGSVYNLIDWLTMANITGGFDTGSFGIYDASGNVIAGDLDLPTLGAGMYWDVSAFSKYGVLVVVPEPGRAVLLLLGLGSLIMRRRRAGR